MQRYAQLHLGRSAAAVAVAVMAGAVQATPANQVLSIDELRVMEAAHRFSSDRLIVKFRADLSEAQQEQALRAIQAPGHRSLYGARGRNRDMERYHVVQLSRLWSVPGAIAQLRREPGVEDVQPDWLLELQDSAPADDPGFSGQWDMQGAATTPANPYGTGVAALWQQGYNCVSTQPVYVAVLDTGARTTHEDLRSNLYANPGDSGVDGVDNDGNGFIDDVKGWNFYAHTNNVEDDHSHGSHVSGTIAARRNNALGVAGMCGDGGAKILPVKVCDRGGGCATSDVLAGVAYVVDLKTHHGINVVAVNLSLGRMFVNPVNTGIEYFQAARDANIMVAAAAGNSGADLDTLFMWPASLAVENILSVANLQADGKLAGNSNYGVTSVDIAAPGGSIYSTVNSSDSAYNWKSGTSMASPHVAGAIALYRVLHPAAGVQETRDALLSTAAVEPTLVGKVAGARRLDVSHWTWGSATSFRTRCGSNLTRKTAFWLGTTAYGDGSLQTPLPQMGVALTVVNPQGVLLGSYAGKTDANGQVMWMFNGTQQPWGAQFSVTVRSDDGGSHSYTSGELGCFSGQ